MKKRAFWHFNLGVLFILLGMVARPLSATERWIDGCISQIKQLASKLGQIDARFALSAESTSMYSEVGNHATLSEIPNGLRYLVGYKRHYYKIEVLWDPKARPYRWHSVPSSVSYYSLWHRNVRGARAGIEASVAELTEDDGDEADRRRIFIPAAKRVVEQCLKLASQPIFRAK